MRDFTRGSGRLRALPVAARAVYTVFLAFTLVAMGLTGWLASEMVGVDLARFGSYYAGAPEQVEGAPEPTEGGPALELPDEPVMAVAEPMPRRKLLEVTHFHLFSMPVYLLVLSHIFMLSGVRDAPKLGWIAAASVATAVHAAAPWLAASGTAGSAIVYAVSGTLLAASFLVMSIVPAWEMWAPAPTKPPRRAPASTPPPPISAE